MLHCTMGRMSCRRPQRSPLPRRAIHHTHTPVLEDEPFFVRTVPDDRQQSQAMAMLIERYGWQRIALLHTETAYSNDGANLVAARLPSSVEVESVLLPRNMTHAQRQAALLPLTVCHLVVAS